MMSLCMCAQSSGMFILYGLLSRSLVSRFPIQKKVILKIKHYSPFALVHAARDLGYDWNWGVLKLTVFISKATWWF